MKTTLLSLAALLCFSVAAQAQTTPTSPQRAGVGNQTTLPPTNPTMPNNPGTISQQGVDQQPTMQRNTNLDVNTPQGEPQTRNAVDQLPPREQAQPNRARTTRPRSVRRGTSPAPATVPPQR